MGQSATPEGSRGWMEGYRHACVFVCDGGCKMSVCVCGEGGCKCKVEKRSFSSMLTVYSCKKTKLLNPPKSCSCFSVCQHTTQWCINSECDQTCFTVYSIKCQKIYLKKTFKLMFSKIYSKVLFSRTLIVQNPKIFLVRSKRRKAANIGGLGASNVWHFCLKIVAMADQWINQYIFAALFLLRKYDTSVACFSTKAIF